MANTLYRRLVIDQILPFLPTRDIIVLHGARQVGKTSILAYLKNLLDDKKEATIYLDLEDLRLARILDGGVDTFLNYLAEEGFDLPKLRAADDKLFVFIDEIQYLAQPSSFLKLIADHQPGLKLIVSGSSSFDIKNKFKNSLVGRTIEFVIYSLSFAEFLLFKKYPYQPGRVFTDKKTDELLSLYREYVLSGGYPKITLTGAKTMKEKYLQQIIDTYIRKDIRDLAEIRDIQKFNQLLEILAAQSGQILNISELAATCGLARQTIVHYLFLLEQTYIIRLVRPFSRNLRTEISKNPKIFFLDTGLMQMLWLKQLPKQVLGQVLETSVFVELVKKYGPENVFFWRTKDKKEIDFILRTPKGILPIEVKSDFARFQSAAVSGFASKYKTTKYKVVGLHGRPANDRQIYPWDI